MTMDCIRKRKLMGLTGLNLAGLKYGYLALAGVAHGLSTGLQTKGLPVRFPVRAHAWVVGQVPSRGRLRGNIDVSLSLYSPLSKNK